MKQLSLVLVLVVLGSFPSPHNHPETHRSKEKKDFPRPYRSMDLSELDFLEYSGKYQVKVNGMAIPVYISKYNGHRYDSLKWDYGDHISNGIRNMSFTGFDMPSHTNDDTLSIEIILRDSSNFDHYDIRPWSHNVAPTVGSKTMKFDLDRPQKLVITTNNELEDVLVITANPHHTPPAPSPNIRYFGGDSIHSQVERYRLKDGDSVYIAENAIVQGAFDLAHTHNVTVFGRGIVYNGDELHDEDYSVFFADYAKNLFIEGITITNSPGWNIRSYVSENVTIRNVKEIGQWLYNTDGVQTGANGLLVEDCFLQTNDDCFTLNGTAQDIEIRNNISWNIFNGSHTMLGWNSARVKNAHSHDNIVIRNGDCCIASPHKISGPLTMRLKAPTDKWGANYYENILIENLTVEEIVNKGVWLSMAVDTLVPQLFMKNVKYKNINIIKADTVWGNISGNTSYDRPIQNIVFENVRINGSCIDSAEEGNLSLEHTKNIVFMAVDTTVTKSGYILTSNAENASYQWYDCDNGHTPIEGATDRSFAPAKPGSYAVSVTKNGCTGRSLCHKGDVNRPPTAMASADVYEGTVPLQVHFNGENSWDDQEIVDYLWDFNDGTATSSLPDPIHTFTTPGTYLVSLTVFDTAKLTDTKSVSITVNTPANRPPRAVASASPDKGELPLEVRFKGSNSIDDGAIVGYVWDFKDGSTSTKADPVHTFDRAGTYLVELTVTDNHGLIDTTKIIVAVASISGELTGIILNNPAKGETVKIQLVNKPPGLKVRRIHLHDLNGRSLSSFDSDDPNDKDIYELPVTALSVGLYLISMEIEGTEDIRLKLLVDK